MGTSEGAELEKESGGEADAYAGAASEACADGNCGPEGIDAAWEGLRPEREKKVEE